MRRFLWLLLPAALIVFVRCEFGSDRFKHIQTLYNGTFTLNPSERGDQAYLVTSGDTMYGSFAVSDSGKINFQVFGRYYYHNGPQDSAHALYSRSGRSSDNFAFAMTQDDSTFFEFDNPNSESLRHVEFLLHRSYWANQ